MQINRREFLGFVLVIQLMSYAAILFDISIARQIILGVYLLFIPGAILLRIFRLNMNKTETIIFSVGLSVALLMFVGLSVNEIFFLIGISKPLENLPLMVTLSTVVIGLCLTDFRLTKKILSTVDLISLPKKLLLGALISFPFFLSILGTVYVNTSGNNALMLLLIITISVLVIPCVLLKRTLRPKLYPLIILSISSALLLHTSLTSRYLVGYDIHPEYHISELTQLASYWNKTIPDPYNAMLSVAVLPTMCSNLLNMDPTWVFKILYPLIFSLVPLGLYLIYRKQMGNIAAFLSAFFFMASSTFYNVQMLSLGRQMIAELFFVLLLYLLLDRRIDHWKRRILLIIFGAALVFSHYSLSYLFLFYLVLTWLLSRVRILGRKLRELTHFQYILLFSAVTFLWYICVALSAPFTSLVDVLGKMYNNFVADFLNLGSRGYLVERTLGAGSYSSLLHRTGSIFQNITEFFILFGFITTMAKRNGVKLSQKFVSMSVASMTILFASILVPFFAPALNIPRVYHITLFLLSPFCIQGASVFFRRILNAFTNRVSIRVLQRLTRNVPILISMILIAFFLFEIGFIYEVSGDHPTSIPLSKNRMNKIQLSIPYTTEQEVFSAEWLSGNTIKSSQIFADEIAGGNVLKSYGGIPRTRISPLSVGYQTIEEGYVYLRRLNVVEGIIHGPRLQAWNTSDIHPLLNEMNKIYSNGESDVYRACERK